MDLGLGGRTRDRLRRLRRINITPSSVRERIDGSRSRTPSGARASGWAHTLAREVGPDVTTVNSIAPGQIDTERLAEVYAEDRASTTCVGFPLRRLSRPREVTDVLCMLASARPSYVTGAVVPVDGGLTRSLL